MSNFFLCSQNWSSECPWTCLSLWGHGLCSVLFQYSPQLCSPPNPALLFTQVYQEDSYRNHPVSDPRLVAWVLCGPTAPIVLLCVASHMQSPNCTLISLFQRVIVFSSVLSGPPWEHLLLGFPGFSVDSVFAEWGSSCRTVFAVGKHWPIDPALRLKGLEESLWGFTGFLRRYRLIFLD